MIAPDSGEVVELRVQGGEQVKAGQLLLRLENRPLEYEIREIEGQLLQMKQLSRQPEMEALLQRRIGQTDELSRRLKGMLDQIESYQGRVIPAMDLASLLQSYNASQQMVEAARLELEEKQQSYLLYGPLAQSKRSLGQQLAVLRARQRSLEIRAPRDGQVSDLLVQQGAWIETGQSLLYLGGGRTLEVEAYLEPRHLDYAQVGQRVWVNLPNGDQYAARVAQPPELAERTPSMLKGPFDGEKPALRLMLQFDTPPQHHLPEGLPVEVRFDRISRLLEATPGDQVRPETG